ncbi:MAG: apolipoprotein N-acyltransferase [Acidobacteria bacterium 13_1_40CM_4_69_4]|nr:MAG: apolipoprotein N-acyltransferase [Acidobacteria bacterium 13_1_40CM_4_69_4]
MNASPSGGPGRGLFLACLSGLLLALAYPLADIGVVAFVALVPFLLSLQDAWRGAALARGYACGAAFFSALLYWIPAVMQTYGGLPAVVSWLVLALLVFYLATYFALFAWLVAASWRRFGPLALASAPVGWVALELARGRLLTGFPWGLLGYSQYRDMPLVQAAAWGGIYAVSWVVLAANAGVALLMVRPGDTRLRAAGAALVTLTAAVHVAGFAGLRVAAHEPEGRSLRVAAIQANVAQSVKWNPGSAGRIVSDLARLTRQAAASGARLIVWPESSSPISVRRPAPAGASGSTVVTDTAYVSLLGELARTLDVDLIVGSIDYSPRGAGLRAHNAAFAIGPAGALGTSYDKVHLVPFGEYVPLQGLLFFVNRMVQGAIAEFAPGERLEPLPTRSGRAATFICYEAIFPELVRHIARRDAAFLVNITNDAWFGRSAAPYQHLAMATVRAVENRRSMVRAANTGISALIDPYGRIIAGTPLMESAVLSGSVSLRDDRTVYARCGDLFAWGCAILTVLQAAALRAAFSRSDH